MPVNLDELSMTIPGAENPMQVTCRILVDGNEIDAAIPVSQVSIEREINKIPTATITIIDGDVSLQTFAISDGDLFIPGNLIEIQLGYQTDAATVFKGIIIGHANRIQENTTQLVVTCKDEVVKMTLEKKFRHFADITDSDVAEQIIGEYGLQHEIETTTVQHTNLLQSNMTDWDFLLYRFDMLGLFVNVVDGKITAAKPDLQKEKIFDVIYGATLISYEAQMDARMQSEATSAGSWSYTNQQLTTVDANEPNLQQSGNLEATTLASGLGYASNTLRYPGQWTEAELQALADAGLQKQRLSKIRGRVKFQGVGTTTPGEFIVVAGVGARFSGPLLVSATTHQYEDGNWLTEASLGLDPVWFAEKVNPFHPSSATGILSSVSGLQAGIVTDNEDPAGEFRVRVKLPAVNASETGLWARVATLDAGEERGTFFRPEIDDEVIVGFVGDDLREPVILGMLHSSAKAAPLQPSNDNHEKGYQSRGGFKMIFNDEANSLTIESPGGRKILIDDTEGIITLDDGTGNKMTIESSGVTVESSSALTIKGGASIKLEAPQIEISGSGQLKLGGGIVMIN
jgi:Rhs element Vgr protein